MSARVYIYIYVKGVYIYIYICLWRTTLYVEEGTHMFCPSIVRASSHIEETINIKPGWHLNLITDYTKINALTTYSIE